MEREQAKELRQATQDGGSSSAFVDYAIGPACLSYGGYLNG